MQIQHLRHIVSVWMTPFFVLLDSKETKIKCFFFVFNLLWTSLASALCSVATQHYTIFLPWFFSSFSKVMSELNSESKMKIEPNVNRDIFPMGDSKSWNSVIKVYLMLSWPSLKRLTQPLSKNNALKDQKELSEQQEQLRPVLECAGEELLTIHQ